MIREERRKKKRRKHIFRGILIFIAILAIAVVIGIKVFVIKNVEVEGNSLYDAATIEKVVLNDEYSWNTLYVFFKYRFKKTENLPFIDTMDITLKDPQTIHIEVYEKGTMGYLYISGIGENAYFDKDGIVVETSSDVLPDIPKIEGVSCDEVVLYEKLPIPEELLKDMLTLTQALKRNNLVPDSITYDSQSLPILTYGKVKVEVGDTDKLTQKVERISKILPSLNGMSGTLHLENWTEETTNIVFDKNE